MREILFHQNVSYKVNDIYVIDGIVYESLSDSMQYEASRLLHNKNMKLKQIWMPSIITHKYSKNLKIYFGIHDVRIIASSLTLDESNRFIPYIYYLSSYTDTEEVVCNLNKAIEKSGLTPNKNDLIVIRWALDAIKKEKIGLVVAGIFAVSAILYRIFH